MWVRRGALAGLQLATVVWLVAGASGAAEPAPLVSDRPKQALSSAVMDSGFYQVEAGLRYRDENGRELTTAPEVLVRVGLIPNLELRLGSDLFQYEERSGKNESGLGDGEAGLKLYLLPEEQERGLPELALLGTLNLPIGSDRLTSDELDPEIRALASHTLSDVSSLHYNLGLRMENEVKRGKEDQESFLTYALAYEQWMLPEVSGFVEVFGDVGLSGDRDRHHLAVGGSYRLTTAVALDAFVGGGLSSDAPDLIAGLGMTLALP